MPIVDVWMFTVKMGKAPDAVKWLKRNYEYHATQGITGRILNPINGDTSKILTSTEYESLQAMQDYLGKFFKSDAWTKDFGKEPWTEWFVDNGSSRYQYNVVK